MRYLFLALVFCYSCSSYENNATEKTLTWNKITALEKSLSAAVSFVIGGNAYIGLGWNKEGFNKKFLCIIRRLDNG